MGTQPRQFLGDVDADRVGGRFVDRTLLQGLPWNALRGVGGLQRFLPALKELLLLALHDGRHQRLGFGGQLAQAAHALHQHGDQALAFARTGFGEPGNRPPGGVQRDLVEPFGHAAALAPLQHLMHRQRLRLR